MLLFLLACVLGNEELGLQVHKDAHAPVLLGLSHVNRTQPAELSSGQRNEDSDQMIRLSEVRGISTRATTMETLICVCVCVCVCVCE